MAKIQNQLLATDPVGLANLLEREAQTMHSLQFYREAVVNEIEAGATKVVIDGWQSPDKHLLARVSGNGKGMSHQELVEHLATVLKTSKGAHNWGIGARIAALPLNKGGVSFASRTAAKNEGDGMIMLFKDGSRYCLKNWEIDDLDADGDPIDAVERVVVPDPGQLDQIGTESGTAVILHGSGSGSTWNDSLSHEVHNWLARRFFRFAGTTSVSVRHRDGKSMRVVPFGEAIERAAQGNGQLQFADVGGLSGTMFWWIIPASNERKKILSGHDDMGTGIGLLVDNEIFDYKLDYLTDFGIPYKSVQRRIVILIQVDGAEMDTSRSSVVYPLCKKESLRRNTPWKSLGKHFCEHMPAEIDELLSQVSVSSSIFSEDSAKKLDADWMKWIKPVQVLVRGKTGAPGVGNQIGSALAPGNQNAGGGGHGGKRGSVATHRAAGGVKPSRIVTKVVTPSVVFVDAKEMPDDHPHIMWVETKSMVQISREFPPFVREVQRWIEKTEHKKSVVRAAIESAYQVEYAAHIIDANGQRAAKLDAEQIEQLKSDMALYAKALGCQSLSETILAYLKAAAKSV